jgi:hypothetical protein
LRRNLFYGVGSRTNNGSLKYARQKLPKKKERAIGT